MISKSAKSVRTRIDKSIAVGLVVVLFFTALAHGAVEPWSIAIFELMLIGILLLWGIKITLEHRLEMDIPATTLPMAALLLLGIMQSLTFTGDGRERLSLSMDVEATGHAVTVLFFLIFAFVATANFLVHRERLFKLTNVLTVFGAGLAVFALVQHFTWNGRFYWLRPTSFSVFGPFVDRNNFAGYMAMLMPFPLGLILFVVRGQARLLYGFAAVLMGIAAIISNSRSGVIGLAGSMVFMAVLARRMRPSPGASRHPLGEGEDRRLGLWRIGPIAVVASAVIAGVVWIGASAIVEHFGDAVDQLMESGTPDVGRAEIWSGTLGLIRHHPLLGAGLGAYGTVYPTYETAPSLLRTTFAHNDYLQVLADCGVAGGILAVWFIAVIFLAIYRGVASPDPLRASMSLAAGGGIVAVLIQSLAETDLQIPSNALLFLLLVAVASHIQEPEAVLLEE